MPRPVAFKTVQQSADELLNLAVYRHQIGQLDEAHALYRKVLRLAPHHFRALLGAGIARCQAGQHKQGLELLRTALKVDPVSIDVHMSMGSALKALGRFDDALQSYEAALTRNPKAPEIWNLRGITLAAQKRFGEALLSHEKALSLNESFIDAIVNCGVVLTLLERHEEALIRFDRAAERVPKDPDIQFSRGRTLASLDRHEEAIACYDRALAIRHNYVEALNNKGLSLLVLSRPESALACFEQALLENPRYVRALCNRGLALTSLARLPEALESYNKVLALAPLHAEALYNRASVLLSLGRHDECLADYEKGRRASTAAVDSDKTHVHVLADMRLRQRALADLDTVLAEHPDDSRAWRARGKIVSELQQYAEAASNYERAIKLGMRDLETYIEYGSALASGGRAEDSLAAYDDALAVDAQNAEAWTGRGRALYFLHRHDEALEHHKQATKLDPRCVNALCNLGVLLTQLHRMEEGIQRFDAALALDPDHADTLNCRGIALATMHRDAEALHSFERALVIRPNDPAALNNRGIGLSQLGRLEDAVHSYRRALAVDPQFTEAMNNYGQLLHRLGRDAEARVQFEALVRLAPDHPYAAGGLLWTAQNTCDWEDYDNRVNRVLERVRSGRMSPSVFPVLSLPSTHADQLICARSWVRDKCPSAMEKLWRGERYQHGRIRVAYISADFQEHPVSYLTAGLFEKHDRKRFETFGIALVHEPAPSPSRRRVAAAFEHFRETQDKSDMEVATLLRELEIDIAVDLTGHTMNGRPRIYGFRPAPVQVNYLGLACTLGAEYYDYVVADHVVIARDDEAHFIEKVVRLPHSYMATDDRRPIAPRTAKRSDFGLPDDAFVFCSFNNSYKINPTIFDLWMRLLRQVPHSVLWLSQGSSGVMENLRKEATARGIEAERLIFARKVPSNAEHLARQHLADLFLDTGPYNAHTTAADALWGGLPLLTCAGSTFASRVGASLLAAVGLPELITHTPQDYEALALELTTDRPRLTALRERLVKNITTTPLFDTARFTGNMERALVTMWERAQRDQAPEAFDVVES